MSVQQNTYVIVGVKFPYKHFDEEQHALLEAYEDGAYTGIRHHNGLCALVDGMSGKYVIIGRVLAKGTEGEGILEPVDASLDHELVSEVYLSMVNHVGAMGVRADSADIRPWVLTHYR